MRFVRTLGWLACVVYSTIPLFWLMVHPRAHRWRAREGSPFRVLVPAWIVMWIGVGVADRPVARRSLLLDALAWIPAALLFATGISIYFSAGAHFSWAQLGGLPEVREAGHRNEIDERLVTTGIRSRVRHPVYLGHLCEMLAWSIGTGLAVCWLLTAFAIATGAVMIRMEDAELENRFGEEFRKYRRRVQAVLPQATTNRRNERPQLLSDGIVVAYEEQGHEVWRIAIADLTCIGEYTNESGPWADDYFLVFGVKGGLWYEASLYSDTRDEAVGALGKALGGDLHFGLIQSTTFASRIMWPKELEGQPLVVEKAVNPKLKQLGMSRPL